MGRIWFKAQGGIRVGENWPRCILDVGLPVGRLE